MGPQITPKWHGNHDHWLITSLHSKPVVTGSCTSASSHTQLCSEPWMIHNIIFGPMTEAGSISMAHPSGHISSSLRTTQNILMAWEENPASCHRLRDPRCRRSCPPLSSSSSRPTCSPCSPTLVLTLFREHTKPFPLWGLSLKIPVWRSCGCLTGGPSGPGAPLSPGNPGSPLEPLQPFLPGLPLNPGGPGCPYRKQNDKEALFCKNTRRQRLCNMVTQIMAMMTHIPLHFVRIPSLSTVLCSIVKIHKQILICPQLKFI